MLQCPYRTQSRCDSSDCPGKQDVKFCDARKDVAKYPTPEPRENWQQPTLAQKATSFAVAVAKHVADPRIASPEVQAERKAICEACDNLDKQADRCNVCGCSNMALKRSWPTERCPLNPPKWDVV